MKFGLIGSVVLLMGASMLATGCVVPVNRGTLDELGNESVRAMSGSDSTVKDLTDRDIEAAQKKLDELKARKVLLESAPTARANDTDFMKECRQYVLQGRAAAESKGIGSWFLLGMGGGCMGAIPGALVWALAGETSPLPPLALVPNDPQGMRCFERGYQERAAERNSSAALVGCGITFSTSVLIILLLYAPYF